MNGVGTAPSATSIISRRFSIQIPLPIEDKTDDLLRLPGIKIGKRYLRISLFEGWFEGPYIVEHYKEYLYIRKWRFRSPFLRDIWRWVFLRCNFCKRKFKFGEAPLTFTDHSYVPQLPCQLLYWHDMKMNSYIHPACYHKVKETVYLTLRSVS